MTSGTIWVSRSSSFSLRGEKFGLWTGCQRCMAQHKSKVLTIFTYALLKTAVLLEEQLVLVGFIFNYSFSSTQTAFQCDVRVLELFDPSQCGICLTRLGRQFRGFLQAEAASMAIFYTLQNLDFPFCQPLFHFGSVYRLTAGER